MVTSMNWMETRLEFQIEDVEDVEAICWVQAFPINYGPTGGDLLAAAAQVIKAGCEALCERSHAKFGPKMT